MCVCACMCACVLSIEAVVEVVHCIRQPQCTYMCDNSDDCTVIHIGMHTVCYVPQLIILQTHSTHMHMQCQVVIHTHT